MTHPVPGEGKDWPCAVVGCDRPSSTYLCEHHVSEARQRIAALPALYGQADLELGRGGTGRGQSGSHGIGLRVTALDVTAATEIRHGNHGMDAPGYIWHGLYAWERIIREDRRLEHVGSLPPAEDLGAEVERMCTFLLIHLDWCATQQWADQLLLDVGHLYGAWVTAANARERRARRIPCPADSDEGTCGGLVGIDETDLAAIIVCPRCHEQWTTARLVTVAMSDPNTQVMLDAEAISQWLGIPEREIRRLAATANVTRHGPLYDVQGIRGAWLQREDRRRGPRATHRETA